MGDICSAHHWKPWDFWRCTPHEFMAIVESTDSE
jgi:hypothetical protein